jgi:predicted kinase
MLATRFRGLNMLIIFGGLSGVGKTTVAIELARQIGAMHLRIDSIEQAILDSGLTSKPINEAGYLVAYAIAEDNLRIGRTVIADSVNALPVTRDAWLEVAKRAGVDAMEIEIRCSDADEHKRHVENRITDVRGLKLPTWHEVVSREYHPWDSKDIAIDTARENVEQSVQTLRDMLLQRKR